MTPTINKIVFNLLEGVVTLYPANPNGTPQILAPIWTGSVAESLAIRSNWLMEETKPSGSTYPCRHPLIPQYTINLGRVWILDSQLAPQGYDASYPSYVLDIVWTHEQTQQWYRKTFYGVTIGEQGWNARDIENGLLEDQQFNAQYYVPAFGSSAATMPVISQSLPYTVNYTDANGTVMLYTYDPVAQQFALVGNSALASIGYSSQAFSVAFGTGLPVLQTSGAASPIYDAPGLVYDGGGPPGLPYDSAVMQVNGGLYIGLPSSTDLPRLDFMYGNQRVFTVTTLGLFGMSFTDGQPGTIPAGGYAILSGGSVVAACSPGLVESVQTLTTA